MPETCPHCDKSLPDANAVYCHVKAKHGRAKARTVRPARTDEPSMGELVIEAFENRLAGVENPEWMEAMFGDQLDDMVEQAQ